MAEYSFPVPGADEKKEIVIFARRHFVAFLGQFLLAFLLLVVPFIILIMVSVLGFYPKISQGLIVNFIVLIISAYYLIAITFTFTSWISFYYNVYIVTRGEIIEITQVGFFGRKISQLSLLRVQDVTSSIKGILPTLFSYGDVLVETASEAQENFLLQSVPNPQEICSKIMALHDEVIKREERHEQILEGEGTLVPGPISENPPATAPKPEEKTEPEKNRTPYEELLAKEKEQPKEENRAEGEISKDDLEKGGEIDLKQ